jgi:hypothetical protein
LSASMKRARVTHFSAPANISFLTKLFILKDCGLRLGKKLLALRTFKGQGNPPEPGTHPPGGDTDPVATSLYGPPKRDAYKIRLYLRDGS